MAVELSDGDKSLFMDMESLFEHPGWNRLVQGWHEETRMLPEAAFYNAKSMDDMLAFRVRMGLLRELLDLPNTLSNRKQELLAGNEQAADI